MMMLLMLLMLPMLCRDEAGRRSFAAKSLSQMVDGGDDGGIEDGDEDEDGK